MDFSWLNLSAFRIDDLVRLEGLITREYELRQVWDVAGEIAPQKVEGQPVEVQQVVPQPSNPPNLGKRLREIKRAIRPKQKTGPKRGTKIAPRYRHPHVPSLTWAGRGKTPAWVREWRAGGGTLAQLQICTTR